MSGYIAPQQPIQPQPPLLPVYQEEKGLTVCGIVGVVQVKTTLSLPAE